MRKPDKFEAAFNSLIRIGSGQIDSEAINELRQALNGSNSLLAAKAAEIAGRRNVADLIPDMIAAFNRFMVNGARRGFLIRCINSGRMTHLPHSAECSSCPSRW